MLDNKNRTEPLFYDYNYWVLISNRPNFTQFYSPVAKPKNPLILISFFVPGHPYEAKKLPRCSEESPNLNFFFCTWSPLWGWETAQVFKGEDWTDQDLYDTAHDKQTPWPGKLDIH